LTERLYYRDSFLREFDAQVISCESSQIECAKNEPPSWWVTLEKTAFYPTSGGQQHDMGRLGDALVVDVFEREDGTIVHVTDREVARELTEEIKELLTRRLKARLGRGGAR